MVDSRGLNVEWERPKRANRPNKPNRLCSHYALRFLGVSLDSTDYTLGVPQVSSGVFVVRGSEVGHLSGLKNREDAENIFR
jgi:hypothetical protein